MRRSCEDPVDILEESLLDLAQVLMRGSCGDASEVISLRGPSMILYRSLLEDLVEILVRSFPRGPCMKTLPMPCLRGVSMKALLGCFREVHRVQVLGRSS